MIFGAIALGGCLPAAYAHARRLGIRDPKGGFTSRKPASLPLRRPITRPRDDLPHCINHDARVLLGYPLAYLMANGGAPASCSSPRS
jgi:hypothetical protein